MAWSLAAAIATGVVFSACAPTPKQGLIEQIPDATMTRAELRTRLREIAMELIGYTKSRSYEIYESAQDSATRLAALQMAVRTNEILITAATHRDPVAALIDTWALVVQWRHLLRSEAGREFFGDATDQMLVHLERIENKILVLAGDLAGQEAVARGRERLETWATEHPLTTRMYRPSFTPEIVGLIPERESSIFSVAETLDETVSRVAMRLEILNAQLPQQVAWNAGMLLEKRLGDVDLEALAAQGERVMAMAEDLPQLVETQRDEVFRQVEEFRGETMQGVEVVRDETLEEIDRQRIATIASIEETVGATLDRIHEESSLTVGELKIIANALVEDVNERVLETVDRAFRRLLVLVGVLLAGGGLIAVWSFRHPARRTPER